MNNSMKRSSNHKFLLSLVPLALLATLLPVSLATAAIKTWDGSSSGLWSVGANWSGSTPPQNGDELHFPRGVSRKTTTNDISNLQVTFVWFQDGDATNYVLRGNALTIGAVSPVGGIQSNQTNGLNTIECDITMKRSDISGGQNFLFIFPGTGTLVLSGNITLAEDALTLRSDPNSLLELSGVISGTNGLIVSGAGTVRFDGSSANTYTGATSVQHGVLQLNKSASGVGRTSISGDLSLTSSGIARLLFNDQIAHTADVNVFTALDLNGHSVTIGSLTINGGVITNGGVLDLFGDVTVLASGQIIADVVLGEPFPITFAITNPGVSLQINGGISGGGGLTKTGAGTLTFLGSDANKYLGPPTVRGGGLALNKPLGLAVQGGPLVIGDSSDGNATDTVRFLAANQLSGLDVTINRTGLLDLNGFNGTIPGDLTLIGGEVQTGGGLLHLFNDLTAAAASQGLSSFSAQISGNLFLEPGTHTFTINNGGFLFGATVDLIIDATISGTGAITKIGAGELELDGANTYSGATTVNDGTLFVGNNTGLGSVSSGTTVNDPGRVTLLRSISVASESLTLNSSASNPGALFGAGTSNFWGGNITFSRTSRIGVETNSILNLNGILQGPAGVGEKEDGGTIFSRRRLEWFGGGNLL